MSTEPIFFQDAAELRQWFAVNASTANEVIIGFVKTRSGSNGLTWPQAVDEALCVGWIDGVRHRIDDHRYRIRFTPRKSGSNWSAVNIRRVPALRAEGRMTPAGMTVFAARSDARSHTASYEQEVEPALDADEVRVFKKKADAWAFYQALPASYKRKVTWWVISAKQAATRARRLTKLLEACAQGRRL